MPKKEKEGIWCPMSFNNSGSGEDCSNECFPTCAWWNEDKKECAIVTLAKKLSYM